MPDRFSALAADALAHAVGDGTWIETMELWHPLLTAGAVTAPIRAVAATEDLVATLEADAPRNASETVTFEGIPFEVQLHGTGENGAPRARFSIACMTADMHAAFVAVAGSGEPVAMIYRSYLPAALGAPAEVVDTYELRTISTDLTSASGEVVVAGLDNRVFPYGFYDLTDYPALR